MQRKRVYKRVQKHAPYTYSEHKKKNSFCLSHRSKKLRIRREQIKKEGKKGKKKDKKVEEPRNE